MDISQIKDLVKYAKDAYFILPTTLEPEHRETVVPLFESLGFIEQRIEILDEIKEFDLSVVITCKQYWTTLVDAFFDKLMVGNTLIVLEKSDNSVDTVNEGQFAAQYTSNNSIREYFPYTENGVYLMHSGYCVHFYEATLVK